MAEFIPWSALWLPSRKLNIPFGRGLPCRMITDLTNSEWICNSIHNIVDLRLTPSKACQARIRASGQPTMRCEHKKGLSL